MRQIVKLRLNRDGTLTVRIGPHVEHISTDTKSKGELYDAVKYACISKGVNLNSINLTELIYDAMGFKLAA